MGASTSTWAWLLRWAQQITGRVNTTLSFWLITLVYVILGLMEVDDSAQKAKAFLGPEAARRLLSATADTARKFRKYMVVRTQMSLATGVLVGRFAWVAGLPFAVEWGVIAFALNYVPFIGPSSRLCSRLCSRWRNSPRGRPLWAFSSASTSSSSSSAATSSRAYRATCSRSRPWWYCSPSSSGPSLWGLYGAFIGVPIAIAALTFCGHYPATRWIAGLLGGLLPVKGDKALAG